MAHTPTLDQKLAIETIDRNVVVVAGAGSGKTRVLVDRYLYLLRQGVSFNRILAITFTRKAAMEMKDRIRSGMAQIPGLPADLIRNFNQAQISTIHSFCQRLVADHPDKACVDPRFRTAEEWGAGGVRQQVTGRFRKAGVACPNIPANSRRGEDLIDVYERVIQGSALYRPDRSNQLQVDAHRRELRARFPMAAVSHQTHGKQETGCGRSQPCSRKSGLNGPMEQETFELPAFWRQLEQRT